jgi:hypothetical protein
VTICCITRSINLEEGKCENQARLENAVRFHRQGNFQLRNIRRRAKVNLFMYDPNIDMNQSKDLVVQSNQSEWKKDDRAKIRKQKPSHMFLWFVIFVMLITLVGCDSLLSQNEPSQQIHGIVTQVETGKDGVQVELETETGQYNVTISIIQAEIDGDFERIKIGTEIEVAGQLLDGVSPPLIVAEKVTVLEHED